MLCPECGKEMRLSHDPLTETFNGEPFTCSGLEYYVCPSCGEVAMSTDMATRQARDVARQRAERKGLLSPDEIIALRRSLGLTQKDFERVIGVSSPTVCRWERGVVQQSQVADHMMRALRYSPDLARHLIERAEVHRTATVTIKRSDKWGNGPVRWDATSDNKEPKVV